MSTVQLHLGDCLDILPTLEAGSVDCLICDPPYGTRVDRDGYGRRQLYQGQQHIAGDESTEVMEQALGLAYGVLKPDAWGCVFCSPKLRRESEDACMRAGFNVVGEIVWDKQCPGLGGGIRYQHETILLLAKGTVSGHASIPSVLSMTHRRPGKATVHPHEKPVKLMRLLIEYASLDCETILDPFAGSGPVGVAAARLDRGYIGIEIDPAHYATAERRIDAERNRHPLFAGLSDG